MTGWKCLFRMYTRWAERGYKYEVLDILPGETGLKMSLGKEVLMALRMKGVTG